LDEVFGTHGDDAVETFARSTCGKYRIEVSLGDYIHIDANVMRLFALLALLAVVFLRFGPQPISPTPVIQIPVLVLSEVNLREKVTR